MHLRWSRQLRCIKLIDLKKKAPVDAERQAAQFLLLMDWLPAAGYEHYEISNFARPGMRSRHNSSYWQGVRYYGFGPSAHSYNGSSRQWNVANNALYIQALAQGSIPAEAELLTSVQQLNEYIMISLRTMEGLDIQHVEAKFGKEQIRTHS
jgi:oxygen-independent coproporphyrinogen III oxidase